MPEDWLTGLNARDESSAAEELLTVCSSKRWASRLVAMRPFADGEDLLRNADEVWMSLEPADWLEALAGHPRIGEQGGASQEHSRVEQAGVADSPDSVVTALAEGNSLYEERFGHVFLISAAGRSAEEILAELNRRQNNTPEEEVREAAEQHRRITRLRLQRLLETTAGKR